MKVLFVQDNALDESQALIELGAYLRSHGHPCTLLLQREERDLLASARRFEPGLVVVACSMLNHSWARGIARTLEPLGAPIVMGGTCPTLFPDPLRGAPILGLVQGEAERPILAVVEALEGGARPDALASIPGFLVRRGSEFEGTPPGPPLDMAELPPCDKDLYYERYPFMRAFPFKRFLSSRGCHHRCSYCYISTLNRIQPKLGRRRTRRKDPEVAVAEVAAEARRGPLSHVHFSDDLFTDDPDWLDAFALAWRRDVGLPFTCNTSAELIDDRRARALGEAGCFACGFAVETASARVRIQVLRKGVTEDNIQAAAEHLRRHRIRVATFNMIGLPGETPEEALGTAVLNARIRADFVRLNFAFPMPGTGMGDYAAEHGFLPADWLERFASPDFRYRPGPQFITPHEREFRNLFVLFRAVAADARALPAVRRALSAPMIPGLHRALTLQGAWNEKRYFRIPTVAGLRFFGRVGRPELRSTNFPALI